ncbi:ferritin-like domain-containing protein [Microlunatus speluncae]|uniref:ferritin-like domain-containing protein n=1 Tax=Microlunatus speluncae TaxID=2594267 RepID=UPI0012666D86|nr:ferritin-like domain-containing protein [Microlunatus speluncae]
MFGRKFTADLINRSAETEGDRRRFLKGAGIAGLGVIGAGALNAGTASADVSGAALSDASVLNFALNLEYLEAQFYLYAVTGNGLPSKLTSGTGKQGKVTGGHKVRFKSRKTREYATEIAADELAHVNFLRSALGSAAVAQPAIDLKASFTAAAQAAGIVKKGREFDAFECEENFLLAAYLFEDVGVTAYKGAAPLIQNKTYLEAAAGILAVEAYHAANIRTLIYEDNQGLLGGLLGGHDLKKAAGKLSDARDALSGSVDNDQGVEDSDGDANIVPADENGVAYSRSAGDVLNIVYLNPAKVSKGGFYPAGMNGDIVTSNNNA